MDSLFYLYCKFFDLWINFMQTIIQDELPEVLEFRVVLKNIFWNPLLADPRTSVSRELKSAIEQELQLLIASSDIKISSGRPDNQAKYPIELEAWVNILQNARGLE